MKIRVLGSGGCRALPRPTCFCRVCKDAREKGEPYKRTGCSIFFEDEKIVIDTPEEINYQLNREKIEKVNYILYSHWDPDHTLGMRVIEQLHNSEWSRYGGINPVKIRALKGVEKEIRDIKNMFGSYMSYYESKNLCEFKSCESLKVGDLDISLYPIVSDKTSTVFLFKHENKKVIYAPCDIKPFPMNDEFKNADLMIMGAYMPDSFITNDKMFNSNVTLYSELYTAGKILEIKKSLNIKRLIITHIEEEWQKTFDDYKELEVLYNAEIEFAFDGMIIDL
ncbi:MAG: MBL fold metallo-hydrolase [Sarcina sp.]